MNHYTYLITVKNPTDSRRFYVGVRSCKDVPENDKYLGSSKHFSEWIKQNPNAEVEKQVLSIWPTRKDAIEHEMLLHDCFDIPKNKEFWNKAKQLTCGFTTSGTKASEETKKKLSLVRKGRIVSEEQKLKISKSKIGHEVKPETREKLRNFFTGKKRGPMSQEQKDIRSKLLSGRKWYNNGERLVFCEEGKQPKGFVLGDSIRNKNLVKGLVWYNDGITERYFKEGSQPETFVRGRLKGTKNGIST